MARPFLRTWMLGIATAGCAATSGARPHEMDAAQHEREADAHATMAEAHAGPDSSSGVERERCTPHGSAIGAEMRGVCWNSVASPTPEHLRAAEEHPRHAADHRAASMALRDAEARACAGIAAEDRGISPFEHLEDVASIAPLNESASGKASMPRTAGAIVTFRAVPGMTVEWLQRVVDCHLARNAALGHVVPEMPDCPLVPRGAEARVCSTASGFAVAVRSNDADAAREILARAQRLRSPP